jgi:tetratricopeptide (TPR) repeat protein
MPLRSVVVMLRIFMAAMIGGSLAQAQTPVPTTPSVSPSATSGGPPPTAAVAPGPTQASAGMPSTAKAMQLYRNGKLDDAAAEYQRVIDAGYNAPAGYAGLARVELRRHKVAEAAVAANKGIELGPNLAATHVALGEVYIRQGRLEDAIEQFRPLVAANTSDARAYYGLARVFHLATYHKKESLLLARAHELDPRDPEIEGAWLRTQGWDARIKAIQDRLEDPLLEPEKKKSLEAQLERYKTYESQPARPCSLAPGASSTETNLKQVMATASVVEGYGLGVKLNGTPSTLLLDTGASGVLISRRIAEKAGIEKLSEQHFAGIGDNHDVLGYLGYAKSLVIGDFEFHDCYVDVIDKNFNENSDGLLGADVFAHFMVELDFPNQKLRISPLPVDPAVGAEKASLDSNKDTVAQPHDRYISPDMKDFFLAYLDGHDLLIPTKLNDQAPFLLVMDTGAQTTLISLDAARKIGKVSESEGQMRGIGGVAKKVYLTTFVHLQFASFRQRIDTLPCLDLSHLSNLSGIETSGFLGFGLLSMLDMKIDYRDAMISLKFDPKRFHGDMFPQQSYTHH